MTKFKYGLHFRKDKYSLAQGLYPLFDGLFDKVRTEILKGKLSPQLVKDMALTYSIKSRSVDFGEPTIYCFKVTLADYNRDYYITNSLAWCKSNSPFKDFFRLNKNENDRFEKESECLDSKTIVKDWIVRQALRELLNADAKISIRHFDGVFDEYKAYLVNWSKLIYNQARKSDKFVPLLVNSLTQKPFDFMKLDGQIIIEHKPPYNPFLYNTDDPEKLAKLNRMCYDTIVYNVDCKGILLRLEYNSDKSKLISINTKIGNITNLKIQEHLMTLISGLQNIQINCNQFPELNDFNFDSIK